MHPFKFAKSNHKIALIKLKKTFAPPALSVTMYKLAGSHWLICDTSSAIRLLKWSDPSNNLPKSLAKACMDNAAPVLTDWVLPLYVCKWDALTKIKKTKLKVLSNSESSSTVANDYVIPLKKGPTMRCHHDGTPLPFF